MAKPEQGVELRGTFRPWRLIAAVFAVMLAISAISRWYARDVTLPRYCEDPERALSDLRRVLTEERPAGEGPRRPFIVAARLAFLVPRNGDEPLEDYFRRLRSHIAERCP